MTKLGPQVLELRQHAAVVGKLYNKSGTVYNSGGGDKLQWADKLFTNNISMCHGSFLCRGKF